MMKWLNSSLFPPPSQVFAVFIENHVEFARALSETGTSVLLGFALSIFIGFFISLLMTLIPAVKHAALPFAIFFQTVPIIAVAPLLVIYFGFGQPTVVAATTLVSIFPIIANCVVALSATSLETLELFQLYGASRWQIFWRLRMPSAYLGIYSGLQVAAGLAVIGAVAGEFVAGGGLGAMIDSARTQQRIDIVFAALISLSGLGLVVISLIQVLNWIILKFRPFTEIS